MIMCLNLYKQIVEINYKVHSVDYNTMSAIQSLSKDVWDIKSSNSNNAYNYSGGFE
jgi:tagatose-1,6-bisphosphate aldolase non-catalytic subunit AgaZ/GatZ